MNREILFRGKQKGNGMWLCGDLRQWSETRKGICDYALKHTIEVDSATVGQYTGMTDKNGKRIFEGDILHFDYTGKHLGVEGAAPVIFENGKFGVKWGWHKDFVCLDGFANTTMEIVGNIHDNPELLGGAQDG